MCGIAGIINFNGFDLNALKLSLLHRGPDDQSIFVDKNIALIQTRLAIQDLLNGRQPFHYKHYSIIFNGEIYNHLDLRRYLIDFSFYTRSDTETLLYLYVKYGVAMFSMLDGMYAFCIYNKINNNIILGRDRAGKKPLYYINENDSFIFASELNAIKAIKKLNIDEAAIRCYIRAGFIFKSYTPYKNVYEVEPASYMTINLDNLQIQQKKYYNILDSYYLRKENLSLKDAVAQVDEKLQKSIADRLLSSDIDVGIFLSGGIDSNLIVAIASQVKSKIKTFTVKFEGSYDESYLAKRTVEKYHTAHSELQLSMNLNNDVERILTFYGEPFMDSSAVPSYYIANEAKKSVSVVLNGDGADELFGGYRRYVPIAMNMFRYVNYFSLLPKMLPKPSHKQSIYNYLYRLLCMANKKGLDFYLSATSDIFEDLLYFQKNHILDEMDEFISSSLNDKRLTPLSKMLYLDFNLLLFSDLLVKMDIATMANSLEARSPFLSKDILSLAPTLPDKYKVNKFVTKYVLRELAKKYLPNELIKQPKRGFEVPLKRWVEVDLRSKIYDSLSHGCYSENFFERNFLTKLLQNKNTFPDEKRAKILWGLFCLEVWYKSNKK